MPYFVSTTITYPLPLNTYTHEYAIMDVDGDGDQDIVCARFGPAAEFAGIPIQILLNDGSGGFTDGTDTIFPDGAPVTFHPRGVAIADYNGDGRPDLFIADHGYDEDPWPGAQNTLLLSSGLHGLIDATDRLPQLIDYSHSTTAGDIDGDGDGDILVMNTNGGTPNDSLTDVYILLNDGTGHFVRHDDLLPQSVATREFGSKYVSCMFFDADGDGDQDLFLGAHGGESATNFSRILYNDGTGDFSAAVAVDLPTGPWSPLTAGAVAVTSADLNGDGRLDLIVDQENAYQGHYIQLLINHGAAGFVDETPDRMPQSSEDDGRWIHSVHAVDLNGDGFIDLIARNGQYPPIFLNDGTGHFVNLPASFLDYQGRGGDAPWYVALNPIDANGDGRLDLLADFINGEMLLFTQQDPGPAQTGTDSADGLLGDGDAETLSGLGGDDILSGAAGNDSLFGGLGNDTLIGGAGSDTMRGEGGNDLYVVASAGDVVIEGAGAGTDTVRSSVSLTLGANLENLILAGTAAINGSGNALANVITGDEFANSLFGLAGTDHLNGGGGNDLLDGGAGSDVMAGGFGNDVYRVDGSGDVVSEAAGAGIDLMQSSVTRTLGANMENLTLTGASAINGSGNGGANVINGNGAANRLAGGAGDDRLTGNDGNDTLDGGSGIDRLYGGLGDDMYVVDVAGDYIYEAAGAGLDMVRAAASFTLGLNVENLILTGGNGLAGTGNAGANRLEGNLAANALSGLAGDDRLYGFAGNDTLSGGDGVDWLQGGSGRDQLTGGAGADVFVFDDGDFGANTPGGADVVRDFDTAGGDRFALSMVDANSNLAGDQAFAWLGTGAFTGTAGELRFTQITGNTYLQADLDGDGAADIWLKLDGLHTLERADFVL